MNKKVRTLAFIAAITWPIPATILLVWLNLSIIPKYEYQWLHHIAQNNQLITQTMMVSAMLTLAIAVTRGNVKTILLATAPLISIQLAQNLVTHETNTTTTITTALVIVLPAIILVWATKDYPDGAEPQGNPTDTPLTEETQ